MKGSAKAGIALAALLSLSSAAFAAFAPGDLNFINFGPGLDAPVTNAAGQRIIGPGPYVADLFWSSDTIASPDSLIPAGFNVGFSTLTNNGGGYFIGGGRTLPAPGLSYVLLQVRAWDTNFGATYEQARDSGGEFGFSNAFLKLLDLPPGQPQRLYGMQGFQLQIIPEPSLLSLVLLGAISFYAIALWSRRGRGRLNLGMGSV